MHSVNTNFFLQNLYLLQLLFLMMMSMIHFGEHSYISSSPEEHADIIFQLGIEALPARRFNTLTTGVQC